MPTNIPIRPDMLGEATEQALAAEPVTSLLQIDLDAFLAINDGAGREAGDRVIAASAATSSRWSHPGWPSSRPSCARTACVRASARR